MFERVLLSDPASLRARLAMAEIQLAFRNLDMAEQSFASLAEMPEVAARISQRIPIPTIGIGSGSDCDGQILVTHDLIGTFPWFTPRFVRPKLNASQQIRQAVTDWMLEVEG